MDDIFVHFTTRSCTVCFFSPVAAAKLPGQLGSHTNDHPIGRTQPREWNFYCAKRGSS
uniref:Uncharacterized protein n=1 Tax=Anopheles minimus TaxID=112268 RepID=A0A182WPU1_9DIPT